VDDVTLEKLGGTLGTHVWPHRMPMRSPMTPAQVALRAQLKRTRAYGRWGAVIWTMPKRESRTEGLRRDQR
jgi:hypothetical protein